MTHKFEQSDSGNDLLRARFTLWLNITLAHAKERYLDTHTEKFNIVPLDEFLANTIPDATDHFIRIERSKTGFDFEEEKLAKAFSELSLMRREVLRLLFVEEKTPCEIARQLCISFQCEIQPFTLPPKCKEGRNSCPCPPMQSVFLSVLRSNLIKFW